MHHFIYVETGQWKGDFKMLLGSNFLKTIQTCNNNNRLHVKIFLLTTVFTVHFHPCFLMLYRLIAHALFCWD